MTGAAPLLGVLAGVLCVADLVPYLRDTVRRTTRPHRGTWLIWSVLAVVAFAAQHADGASWSLVMAATQAVATTLVLMVAVRLGTGGASRTELALFGLAGAGVVGWLVADAPIVATACVVAADLAAAAMMVPKTWRDPGSETLSTFVLACAGGAAAAGSVAALELSLLLYPAYFCLVNGALAGLIVHRRRVVAGARATFPLAVRPAVNPNRWSAS